MVYRILLADDSLTIQKVVELTFTDPETTLLAVGNGDRAIQALEDFRPDLVLADVVMPGKTGYDVCETVKSRPGGAFVPVVLLTGTFEPFDRARAERVGSDAIVTKPFDSHALSSLVRDLIRKARAAREEALAAAPPPPPPPAEQPFEEDVAATFILPASRLVPPPVPRQPLPPPPAPAEAEEDLFAEPELPPPAFLSELEPPRPAIAPVSFSSTAPIDTYETVRLKLPTAAELAALTAPHAVLAPPEAPAMAPLPAPLPAEPFEVELTGEAQPPAPARGAPSPFDEPEAIPFDEPPAEAIPFAEEALELPPEPVPAATVEAAPMGEAAAPVAFAALAPPAAPAGAAEPTEVFGLPEEGPATEPEVPVAEAEPFEAAEAPPVSEPPVEEELAETAPAPAPDRAGTALPPEPLAPVEAAAEPFELAETASAEALPELAAEPPAEPFESPAGASAPAEDPFDDTAPHLYVPAAARADEAVETLPEPVSAQAEAEAEPGLDAEAVAEAKVQEEEEALPVEEPLLALAAAAVPEPPLPPTEEPLALPAPEEEAAEPFPEMSLPAPPILEPPIEESVALAAEEPAEAWQAAPVLAPPPPPPPRMSLLPDERPDDEPISRDIEADIEAFERSGRLKRRPEIWEKHAALIGETPPTDIDEAQSGPITVPAFEDEEPAPVATGDLEELAAQTDLSALIPAAVVTASGAGLAAQPAPAEGAPLALAGTEPLRPLGALSEADVDRIARRVVELLADRIVREIAWEVVPDVARKLVRERIAEVEKAV